MYQEHQVCSECKYHSHCQVFNADSACKGDANKDVFGNLYRIGNPVQPGVGNYGFTSWERDSGRNHDGYIYGESCNCDTSHYLDTMGKTEAEKDQ